MATDSAMPPCSNFGCAILGTAPDLPKSVLTIHGPECEVYKWVIPVDPRCNCTARGGLYHSIGCNIFVLHDDAKF